MRRIFFPIFFFISKNIFSTITKEKDPITQKAEKHKHKPNQLNKSYFQNNSGVNAIDLPPLIVSKLNVRDTYCMFFSTVKRMNSAFGRKTGGQHAAAV